MFNFNFEPVYRRYTAISLPGKAGSHGLIPGITQKPAFFKKDILPILSVTLFNSIKINFFTLKYQLKK